jgi:hypothetical protein
MPSSVTMPHSEDAKKWEPDMFGQDMINSIANYTIVAKAVLGLMALVWGVAAGLEA